MFEKYNAVNRGGALEGALNFPQNERMKKDFDNKCMGNRYITTIHVINSAIIKLSKVQKALTVYRGVQGGLLPPEFWNKNDFGVCGGIEFGFMSTTLDESVAKTYAAGGGRRAATIFEIKMGMVDRGADLSGFSQYPHEREICFAPLTGIEVLKTRVDASVLVVEARLNINLAAMTMEQVVSKRKKAFGDMCQNLEMETKLYFNTFREVSKVNELLNNVGILKDRQTVQEYIEVEFRELQKQKPDVFNDDKLFRQNIHKAVGLKTFEYLDAAALDKLSRQGKVASPCLELVMERSRDGDPLIRAAAVKALVKLAEEQDLPTMNRVTELMSDAEPSVREAALEAFGEFA